MKQFSLYLHHYDDLQTGFGTITLCLKLIATTLKFPLLMALQVTDKNMLYFAYAIACRLVTLD